MIEQVTIGLMTYKGMQEAERLKQEGWTIVASTPFSITFEIIKHNKTYE